MAALISVVLLAFAARIYAATTVSVSASASHPIPTSLCQCMLQRSRSSVLILP
jgi:hypothetical protein